MSIADLLEAFDGLGRAGAQPAEPAEPGEPASHLTRKGRKRGRWKPPPASARWSDLFSTCGGGVQTALEVCRDVVGVVQRGDRVHIVTSGWWSMEQPICVVGEQLGPCDLWMISWAVNDDAVLRLVEAMDQGFIRNVRAVIDERMKVLRPAALDILHAAMGAGNLGIMACHAKAYVLRQVKGDLAVAMVTSANWNQNPRPESLCIDADPRAAAVYADWVDQMLETGRAKPYQHTGKLASELLSEHKRYDHDRLEAPGNPHRLYPTHTQLRAWITCQRKWWLIYVAGLDQGTSEAALRGKQTHADAEAYLRGEGPAGPLVAPVAHLLPAPGSGEVEVDIQDTSTPLLARCDWLGFDNDLMVILDHKTTRAKKRHRALRRDDQAMLYAWIAMRHHDRDRCRLRWVWYDDQTVTEIDVSLPEAEAATREARALASTLWNDPPTDVEEHRNLKACYRCDLKEVCSKRVTIRKETDIGTI